MHDETFYVTKGTIRFHAKDGAVIDAKVGDVVVVPPGAPHTFENVSGEETGFFNVSFPCYGGNNVVLMRVLAQDLHTSLLHPILPTVGEVG